MLLRKTGMIETEGLPRVQVKDVDLSFLCHLTTPNLMLRFYTTQIKIGVASFASHRCVGRFQSHNPHGVIWHSIAPTTTR